MKSGVLLPLGLVLCMAAFAAHAQTTCAGDFIVSSSQHFAFDGLWAQTPDEKNGKPIYMRNAGNSGIFYMWYSRYAAPAGPTGNGIAAWVVQSSPASDNGQYYAWATNQDSTESPFETPAADWNHLFAGCAIECVAPVDENAAPPTPTAPSPPPPYMFPTSHTQCPSGFDTSVGDATFEKCKNFCQCTADGDSATCNYCCKKEDNYCLRTLSYTMPTESSGYGRTCNPSKCPASSIGDNKCDGGCNNPDCGFDGGDCCANPATYAHLDTNPLHCQDPSADRYDAENNWRLEYSKGSCRKAPRNQGTCGSCYAFAITTASTHAMCLNDDAAHLMPMSPRYMDTCYTGCQKGWFNLTDPANPTCSELPVDSCSGARLTTVAKELTSQGRGVPTESCYPYSATPAECADNQIKSVSGCTASADYLTTAESEDTYGRWVIQLSPGNFETMKTVLRTIGPVSFGMTLTDAFMYAYDGSHGMDWNTTLDHPKGLFNLTYGGPTMQNNQGGHAMVITGFGQFTDKYKTRNYYVVENSWGFAGTHDLGYLYMDADEDWWAGAEGYAVVPGHLEEDATKVLEFCTASGSCKDLRRRSSSRRMLADDITVLPSDTAETNADDYRGTGEVEETICTRPSVADAIDKGLEEVRKVVGTTLDVELEEMKSCKTQSVAGETFLLRFSVRLGGQFEKDVEINVTRAMGDGTECDVGVLLGDDPDNACQGTGFNLGDWTIQGRFVGDNGLTQDADLNTIAEIFSNRPQAPPAGSTPPPAPPIVPVDIDSGLTFWEVVGAGVVAVLLAAVLVACARMALTRWLKPRGEAGSFVPPPQNGNSAGVYTNPLRASDSTKQVDGNKA